MGNQVSHCISPSASQKKSGIIDKIEIIRIILLLEIFYPLINLVVFNTIQWHFDVLQDNCLTNLARILAGPSVPSRKFAT